VLLLFIKLHGEKIVEKFTKNIILINNLIIFEAVLIREQKKSFEGANSKH